jgi:hypothetical protein
MGIKHVARSALLGAATLISAPAIAQEMRTPITMFFVAIPLDARNAKEQLPNFGLQFQGARPYQNVRIDYDTFKFLPGALAGVEMKYVVAGGIAVVAAIAATHKSKSEQATSQQFQQQQEQQQAACPTKAC